MIALECRTSKIDYNDIRGVDFLIDSLSLVFMVTGRTILDQKRAVEPIELFQTVHDRFGSVLLDSSMTVGDRGRYSFLAHDPLFVITVSDTQTEVLHLREKRTVRYNNEVLDLLDSFWQRPDLIGIGYISYEHAVAAEGVTPLRKYPYPQIQFCFYDRVRRFDHVERKWDDIPFTDHHNEDIFGSLNPAPKPSGDFEPVVSPAISREAYLDSVRKVKEHIRQGDIYQANLTTCFEVASQANPFAVYASLRELNPAPYSAYMNFGDLKILSSSPERMFLKEGDRLTTSPIKGTISRGHTPEEEKRNRNRLSRSDKDKAELLMIVDLERNDLGKLAEPGSVTVDDLFRAETYSSLIHLVADVSARVSEKISVPDIIGAMLPGGSISGAPKKRALEILQELEQSPRGVYTGCIGMVHKGRAEFNIAIRTITHYHNKYYVHAGGGIVADSDPSAEYDEMMLKAHNLLLAIGLKEDWLHPRDWLRQKSRFCPKSRQCR